jgi:hypothetical protein
MASDTSKVCFQAPGQSPSTSSQVGSFRSQLIASSVAFFFSAGDMLIVGIGTPEMS